MALIVGSAQLVFLFNLDLEPAPRARTPAAIPGAPPRWNGRRPRPRRAHGNWGKDLPVVYRWAYDYSVPGAPEDFIPQNEPGPYGRTGGARMSVILVFLLVMAGIARLVAVAPAADRQALAGARRDAALAEHRRSPDADREDRPRRLPRGRRLPVRAVRQRLLHAHGAVATGGRCRCRGCCGSTPACWSLSSVALQWRRGRRAPRQMRRRAARRSLTGGAAAVLSWSGSSSPGASSSPPAISLAGNPANSFFYLLTGTARAAHRSAAWSRWAGRRPAPGSGAARRAAAAQRRALRDLLAFPAARLAGLFVAARRLGQPTSSTSAASC